MITPRLVPTPPIAAMLAGAVLLLLALPTAAAQMGMLAEFEERTTETQSYSVKIRTGPKVSMSGTTMTMTDRGEPVNRHIEVHIVKRSTNEDVKDQLPAVTVTDRATGASHTLYNMTACLTSRHRETEPHFGDNVYLLDGTYDISVTVGEETAIFRDVVLTAF